MEDVGWRGRWLHLKNNSLSGYLKSVDNPRPKGATYVKVGKALSNRSHIQPTEALKERDDFARVGHYPTYLLPSSQRTEFLCKTML